MGTTRLKRKARKNKSRAKQRKLIIQNLNAKPVVKRVDVEGITKEFANKGSKIKALDKKEEPSKTKVDKVVEKTTDVVEVSEKTPDKKKTPAKKPAAEKAATKKEKTEKKPVAKKTEKK